MGARYQSHAIPARASVALIAYKPKFTVSACVTGFAAGNAWRMAKRFVIKRVMLCGIVRNMYKVRTVDHARNPQSTINPFDF